MALQNLWNDAEAAKYTGYDELVYRANILGQDPSVTNWKGGNISGKYLEKDFDGSEIRVLRVKGSGSDLRTAVREDFVGVRHDPVLKLQPREKMSDEEMVAYLAHCIKDIPSKRPSIETLMHSFMPFEHIDHTHADYALWFGAVDGGRKMAEDLLGDELVWVDYHRPGFHLAKTVGEAVKKNPKAKCVILAKHGLLTWGKTSKECYHSTLAMLMKFDQFVQKRLSTTKVFGGPRVQSLPAEKRREILAQVLPAVRGAVSALRPTVLHVDDSDAVLEFVNGSSSRDLASVGAACPDHLVSTKVVPYFAKWEPAGSADDLRKELVQASADYRTQYEAYFKRYNQDPKMKMDDPYPRIFLVPGVGMVTTGKTKEVAIAASWLYHRAITVMKGAQAQGKFVSLTEEESFNIEYWPLERYKLTTLPPDKELTGKVAFITGAAGGIGRAIAEKLASEGAHVVIADINAEGSEKTAKEIGKGAIAAPVDVTSEKGMQDAFRKAVLEFGGVDIVVANAGIARAFPVEDHPLEEWNKLHAILSTGYFLTAREAFRLWKSQGRGGNLVFVVSKNAVVAGKNNVAYSSAKAAELHLARCLAEEGGPAGIRVNIVNPDAVLQKSSIWTREWREERARDYGIKPEELEEFYKKRTTLKVHIYAEDIAEAVYFFASNRSAKTTGNLLNVDGGVPAAYPR
ncbi:MAG TPA: bifunctional rhamnulose-1-phosphate aldolase/short-chain dehydrogenase [Planctomycetota bacterium]|nr:bifunctional rhamnulose-1-phosphate aldolase/short-chain dehydrogenase [Planctomycetota bacterium]